MGILIVGIILQVVIVAILGGKWNKRSPFPLGEGIFNWKIFPVVRMAKIELLFSWGVF